MGGLRGDADMSRLLCWLFGHHWVWLIECERCEYCGMKRVRKST